MGNVLKRALDVFVALILLILSSPFILIACFSVWLQDGKSPIFVQDRVGKNAQTFRLIKVRSMVVHQSSNSADTTSRDDPRITPLGKLLRRSKIDELPQLINVLKGDMSLVGPRPQIIAEFALYTEAERELVLAKPGITDLASIVFLDLEEIAANYHDPNAAYFELVRPWKARLGVYYVRHHDFGLDIAILFLTAVAFINREQAWLLLGRILEKRKAEPQLVDIASRRIQLKPTPLLRQ